MFVKPKSSRISCSEDIITSGESVTTLQRGWRRIPTTRRSLSRLRRPPGGHSSSDNQMHTIRGGNGKSRLLGLPWRLAMRGPVNLASSCLGSLSGQDQSETRSLLVDHVTIVYCRDVRVLS